MISENLNNWLKHGERGISSEAIASHLSGINIVGNWITDYPNDPADFRRCLELLKAVPEFIPRLDEMKSRHPVWAALVENWNELVGIYEEETAMGDRCPRLYEKMRNIIETNDPRYKIKVPYNIRRILHD